MHIKIQGGGNGRYANTGSCSRVVSYLEHEDFKRIQDGKPVETFFSHHNDDVASDAIIDRIDKNKKRLCKKDAKFFMLTVSLSEKEILHLGSTKKEKSEKLRAFIRHGVMEQYAANFNKDLTADDLLYYGKIHHDRKKKTPNSENIHAHIIVSRKTKDGKIRISPMTNHRKTKSGPVKRGFTRTDFYKAAENDFDKRYIYPRELTESFDFNNAQKKGNVKTIQRLARQSFIQKGSRQSQLDTLTDKLQQSGWSDENIERLLQGFKVGVMHKVETGAEKPEMRVEQLKIGLKGNEFVLLMNDLLLTDWNPGSAVGQNQFDRDKKKKQKKKRGRRRR